MHDTPSAIVEKRLEPPREMWRKAESTISALFAFLFGFAILFVALAMYSQVERYPEVWRPLGVVLVALAIEGLFLLWLKHALEAGHHPIVRWVALHQPRWPWVMRPLVAAWALAHAAAAIGVALVLMVQLQIGEDGVAQWLWVLAGVAQFTAIYCSNLYLLMAIGAVWRSPPVIDLLWRCRLILDALLGVLAWWLVYDPWLAKQLLREIRRLLMT